MKTIKATVYIHEDGFGGEELSFYDQRERGFPLLGTKEIEVEIPNVDHLKAYAEMFAHKANIVEAAAEKEVKGLRDKAFKIVRDAAESEMGIKNGK